MGSIVEETGETLIRASHSTNIKERRDCSTALFNARGETLCQAEHIPIHLGSFIGPYPAHHEALRPAGHPAGRRLHRQRRLRGRAARTCPTSCWPSRSSSTTSWSPWTVNLAHHADFVDRGHAHIFQEGLRIPPVRLYRGGELQGDVQDLIPAELHRCRASGSPTCALNARPTGSACSASRHWPRSTAPRRCWGAGEALMDYAERRCARRSPPCPMVPGVFEDVFDNEEVAGLLAALASR